MTQADEHKRIRWACWKVVGTWIEIGSWNGSWRARLNDVQNGGALWATFPPADKIQRGSLK